MGMFDYLGGGVNLDRPKYKTKSKIYSDTAGERRRLIAEKQRQSELTRSANARFRAKKFYETARQTGIEKYRKEKAEREKRSFGNRAVSFIRSQPKTHFQKNIPSAKQIGKAARFFQPSRRGISSLLR